MSDKSGVSSQAITLPQGGGALKGIGETFSPDLFTGTGNLSVPLSLPRGRNGFQPQLILAYSTGSGNGPFGLGWSSSVPGVTRKTSQGVPRYIERPLDPKERDTFILSGAEELVPVAEPVQGVTRFQPRTEGLFARIERVQSDVDDFWRVRAKDGLVSLYGASGGEDAATLRDPAAAHKIFSWKLSETVDTFGNRIEYRYLRDTGSDGPHLWDQLYLQTVRYGDYEAEGETRFLVSVTFVHEERPDPFSEHRAGYEVRTRLRCKRIEIRTHADQERLLRTYELVYVDDRVRAGELPPTVLPRNGVSLLSQIRVVGHDRDATEELPPLEFAYTAFSSEGRRFQPVQGVNDSLPSRSLGHPDFEMVSLFGNGLPDIVQMNDAVQFWRNLGDGRFDVPQTMNEVPAGAHLSDPGVHFADMNGNGRADLLVLEQGGYFPLSFEGRWREGFVRFPRSPHVALDGNARLVDLNGDGVVDVLQTSTDFVLFLNDPIKGWLAPEHRPRRPLDVFPDINLSEPRVKLADLTGDNLQDIVLVEQGRIDYWPYLGHGRWGRRVTMKNSPIFHDIVLGPTDFDPKRVLLADLDGDGLDDIVYVDANRLTFWINQGGNSWSDPVVIEGTPPLTDPDAVRLVDLLGTGMAGILWTFDRVSGTGSNFKFLELTGGLKPYLLTQKDNHMGAVTRIGYASSTKVYLADSKHPETCWKTPLPFPVQVVERVEILDALSGGKLTAEYRYHHGYWDGAEREFRGFGRVEQLDTEIFGSQGAAFSPPLLTKSWFHLGPIGDEFAPRSEADLSAEYWPEDPSLLPRLPSTLQLLRSLPASRRADALRALRGQVLRTELYALDGSERADRPFTVTEFQHGLREEAPLPQDDRTRRSIFFPHAVAQRTTQWERGEEPMTQFSFTDDYDAYGQPRRKVNFAVPRNRDYRVPAAEGEPYLGSLEETRYAQRDDAERYMVDRVAATRQFEVQNDGTLPVLELYAAAQAGQASLQLFEESFNYFDGQGFAGLSLGTLGDFGALVRSESLVLTKHMLEIMYRDPDDPNAPALPPYLRPEAEIPWTSEYPEAFRAAMTDQGGYALADGSDHRSPGYFAQTARTAFDVQLSPAGVGRGLPVRVLDPLGNETRTTYDEPFQLLPTEAVDAVGLTTSAVYDYRVLQPRSVTDPNGNRRAVSFSPLGLVTSSAVMGKIDESVGDTLEVPGRRLEYDFFAFVRRGAPVSVRSSVREHHVTNLQVPESERGATIECVEYSDGFGRLLQTRTQTEDVLFGDPTFGGGVLSPDQALPSGTSSGRSRPPTAGLPNVVVSGWQVYDNKGHVVEKYEPFFSLGLDYEQPRDVQLGQKTRLFHDPRGQLIRSLLPDGSEQRVVYGIPENLHKPDDFTPTPWEVFTYDANDLAPLCRSPEGDSLSGAAPESHHFTPASVVLDALGRSVEATERNGRTEADGFRTRSSYDLRGNLLTLTDALGRVAFRYAYDLANRMWRNKSIDAGLRRLVLNATGQELERRDSKGALTLQIQDRLQRPSRVWARDDSSGNVTLRRRIEYGDAGRPNQPESERSERRALNLLGVARRQHDEAGLTSVAALDFKGNVLDKSRRVVADAPILEVFAEGPANDWHITPFQIDWEPPAGTSLSKWEDQLLDADEYQTTETFNALNRTQRLHLPADVTGVRQELQPEYDRAGALKRVLLGGAVYVEHIAYDAKGQRALIAYGNGVMTRYAYDARTFRLKRLRSERYSKADAVTYRPSGESFQEYAYDYDLAGNLQTITDRTPRSGILDNPDAATETDPILAQLLAGGDALGRRFDHDPMYRLVSASGRECNRAPDDVLLDMPRCTDVTRTRGYTESYTYDALGNLLRLRHRNGSQGFTREFTLQESNNRLRRMQIGNDRFDYGFDANGNMVAEATSRHFQWNHADQMKTFRTQTEGSEPSVHAHYLYDTAGQRVKKLVRKQGGQLEVTHYIDGVFEHHRWGEGIRAGENNHVHVMDTVQRVAIVRLGRAHPDARGPARQFQLGDHLGSSNVVVDSDGAIMNREEFTPYGESSFGSFAKKRYRFTGQERDEESGLNYHAARYLGSWLGRWLNCDPAGLRMGQRDYDRSIAQCTTPDPLFQENLQKCADSQVQCDLYAYATDDPVGFVDPAGTESKLPAVEVWGYSVEFSLFERNLTVARGGRPGSQREKIGTEKAGNLELKLGLGAKVEGSALKQQYDLSEHAFAERSVLTAAAQLGYFDGGVGVGASVTLAEVKAGGQGDVAGVRVKGAVVFSAGVGGAIHIRGGRVEVEGKAGIGFEFELDFSTTDIEPIRLYLPLSRVEPYEPIRHVAYETSPPPLPPFRR